jgi:hypothetical protein
MEAGECGKNHGLYFFGVGVVGLFASMACLKDCTIIKSFCSQTRVIPVTTIYEYKTGDNKHNNHHISSGLSLYLP